MLRVYQADDLEAVYQLITDKDVTRFFPENYSVEKEDVLTSLPRRMERWRKYGFGQLGVFDKTSGEFIGYCGLQPLDKTDEIEVYYGFHKRFWGQGFASEAAGAMMRFGFETAELPRIVGVTHPKNFDSQKVLLKLGMRRGANAHFYGLEATYFAVQKENFDWTKAFFYKMAFDEEKYPQLNES